MDLRDFANKSDENSENYKNSLIIKFCLFWIFLMIICFIISLFTKKIGIMLLWLGIYAVFRRQLIFDKELNKMWEKHKSCIDNKTVTLGQKERIDNSEIDYWT